MNQASVILLFRDPEPLNKNPYSFVASLAAHSFAIGVVALGILATPRIRVLPPVRHDSLRVFDMHTPPIVMNKAAAMQQTLLYHKNEKADKQEAARPSIKVPAGKGKQVILQPDTPQNEALEQTIPLPTMRLWTAPTEQTPKVVPDPQQHDLAKVEANATDAPNHEKDVANQQVASTRSAKRPLPVVPARATPVAQASVYPGSALLETTSSSYAPPTPASILSISNVRMQDGSIPLPHIRETMQGDDSQDEGSRGLKNGEGISENSTSATSSNSMKVREIHQSPTGQYNTVVLGNSIEEFYPETANTWTGRMAYTVYLHVGTARNWILQYSLPESDGSSVTGSSAPLQAPWPIDMVVPALDPRQVSSEALLVHGFITDSGTLEELFIAYPMQFQYASFVTSALQQWHFRPAMQNGQKIRTEILLIIPVTQSDSGLPMASQPQTAPTPTPAPTVAPTTPPDAAPALDHPPS